MRLLGAVALAVVLVVGPVHAGDVQTIEPNPFAIAPSDLPYLREVDRQGNVVGGLRANPFIPDRVDLYDKQNNLTGYTYKSPFLPGQWRVETFNKR